MSCPDCEKLRLIMDQSIRRADNSDAAMVNISSQLSQMTARVKELDSATPSSTVIYGRDIFSWKKLSESLQDQIDDAIARAEKAERERDHAVTAGKRMASLYAPVRDERDALRTRAERLAGLLREAGIHVIYECGLECHAPECDCMSCALIRRIDSALAEVKP